MGHDGGEYLMGLMIRQWKKQPWWAFWRGEIETIDESGKPYGQNQKQLTEGRHIMHECHDRNCPAEKLEENTVGEKDRNEAARGELTGQEKSLIESNALVWNGLCRLPGILKMDKDDARQHIDAVNNIILARAGARANPDLVRKEFKVQEHPDW